VLFAAILASLKRRGVDELMKMYKKNDIEELECDEGARERLKSTFLLPFLGFAVSLAISLVCASSKLHVPEKKWPIIYLHPVLNQTQRIDEKVSSRFWTRQRID
jgi:hypothetical protein